MSGLYYRPSTSELNSEVMDQEGEDDESPLNSLLNDVPNYMQPHPIKSKHNSAVKPDKKNIKDNSVNIKKISSRSSDQQRHHNQKNNPNIDIDQSHGIHDLNENRNHLSEKPSSVDRNSKYWPQYLSSDYLGPIERNFELTNWDWLRLNVLGSGWEEALKEIPVSRREALNLLVIMKKKLLRAASELTFYKERVTILQDQLIHQKRSEEKLIRLQAEFKSQSLDLEKLSKNASRVPLLERTVKQQEELICRLETLLERQRTKQQQDNNEYHQNIEQKYYEEIQALKEQQNRLEEQTIIKNKKMDQIENEKFRTVLADNERLELFKLLDNAELRIKALEEELERQDIRVPRNSNDTGVSRRSNLSKEPSWKYSGPTKTMQSFPLLNREKEQCHLLPYQQKYVDSVYAKEPWESYESITCLPNQCTPSYHIQYKNGLYPNPHIYNNNNK
ncbi:normocyte binding protein 2a, putative [Schistosoma mansoni]|uniref:normocyte binding protein 2a, putative n=1 Tax=Schistosoma mansoni TaxID=6183 RepID=UPI00022C8505|nr:normocyte binding protein 2a, putative [Schistosoma mansoni]|eukprot:XP_018646508.1 normocyte binding protein 2a, putative [Schistosoma mansoni]